MESDAISRSALLAEIDKQNRGQSVDSLVHIGMIVYDMPALDVAPVVRCKECIDRGACIFEDYFSMSGIEDSYCCMGKRMGAKEGLRCHAEEQ